MFRASYKKRYIKYEIIIIISYCISAWFECLCKNRFAAVPKGCNSYAFCFGGKIQLCRIW